MRLLNGRELADFIEERQAKQVRNLRQEYHIIPKLCIIKSKHASPVIDTYVRMKQAYASEILVEVEVISCDQTEMLGEIERANADDSIYGIILQLPIDRPEETDRLVNTIASKKDVDGLGEGARFVSATAEAIDWLLAGYNVELKGKQIALLGRGRLVGGPLEKIWSERGLMIRSFDEHDTDQEYLRTSDVIVTATGVPRVLTSELVKAKAVVVDAGTASEAGTIVGDVDAQLRERDDVTITPAKGGVGPLTVSVMFDHVIQAALIAAGKL